MRWTDLIPGDVVFPTDNTASPWMVISLEEGEDGYPRVKQLNIETGEQTVIQLDAHDNFEFYSDVQILRNGQNVNKR